MTEPYTNCFHYRAGQKFRIDEGKRQSAGNGKVIIEYLFSTPMIHLLSMSRKT